MRWPGVQQKLQGLAITQWLERRRVLRDRLAYPRIRPRANVLRTIYVDVSVISRHDAGTGIQRIVREIAKSLLDHPFDGWKVIPVGASRKYSYHEISWPSQGGAMHRKVLNATPGDVFLGLDFALDTIRHHERQLREFKKDGGEVWFVMYDLLPALRPDWFSDLLTVRFQKWLRVTASLADGYYCISSPVESDLLQMLSQRYGLRGEFSTHVIPMGWDIHQACVDLPPTDAIKAVVHHIRNIPSVLMVGTIEPRKGHHDVLDAFERLWERNFECNLVIVGRPGWKTEQIQARLRHHQFAGRRLFWLSDASDSDLELIYSACSGLVMASYGEGFGLPLLEALGKGKPVLARDIPIFRLHESWGLTFFSEVAASAELATAIENWLSGVRTRYVHPVKDLPTWRDSAQAIWEPLVKEYC